MSKKKFSFDVTGREIFPSERPIADALDAKYGRWGDVVAQNLNVRKRASASIRSALRSGKPRESAFFGVVEEARKASGGVKALNIHGAKVHLLTATISELKTTAKSLTVKTAAAKNSRTAKAPKTPAKKAATKVASAKGTADNAGKSAVRRTRNNPATSKTI